MKLDQAQTLSAIGIAMLQPAFTLLPGFFGSEAKTLLAVDDGAHRRPGGRAGRQRPARSADVFEGEQRLPAASSRLIRCPALSMDSARCGSPRRLSYKVYPGSACLGAVVDCVLNLARQHHIDARKVRAVHVAAGPLTLGMDALSAPYVKGPDTLPTTLNSSRRLQRRRGADRQGAVAAAVHPRPHQGRRRLGAGGTRAPDARRRDGAPRRASARR